MYYYFQIFDNDKLNILFYSTSLILGVYIILRIWKILFKKFILKTEKYKLDKTRFYFIKSLFPFLIFSLTIIFILLTVPELKKQKDYIFSSVAIFSVIVAYAARFSFFNIMAGVFIFFYRPFSLGDYVEVRQEVVKRGEVVDITFRHFVIKDDNNNHVIVPNSFVAKEMVVNYSRCDKRVCLLIDFKVNLYADLDLSKKIILEEIKNIDNLIDKNKNKDIDVIVYDVKHSFVELIINPYFENIHKAYSFRFKIRNNVYERFMNNKLLANCEVV